MIAQYRYAEFGFIRCLNIHHLLTLARIGHRIRLWNDETVTLERQKHQLASRIVNKNRHDILIIFQVDYDADRFSMPASTGSLSAPIWKNFPPVVNTISLSVV